ncbi:M81 family metallopeptidase [Bordetella sp. BOR01]|uniref:M81 family metallopeptidase n=1 Tax=Bordetella sp. BOR01 TaxID=2854779 RepID=UPI001C48C392|nr:M81 family metallopeptidase [Bordetella sp. BOR01]MBV7484643.1 M81 family metallopeptidase [Bordetella sp. BOR01]
MGKRVLVAEFMHETNTFSIRPTGLEAFQACTLHFGDDIPRHYRGTRSSMGAAFEAADEFGWTLAHPVVASANPSGRVTDDFFDDTCARILAAASQADGVLLHLHGAMSVASHDDGEGELLERLRSRIGAQVPVVAVLDLHATVTQQMADHASALIAYRTYPHVDQYERTWQGARLLARAMAGEISPRVALARRPILYALDGGRTTSAPMIELLRRGDAIEAEGQALAVSIQAGFSSADVHDIGPSVAVTVDGDPTAGQAIAEQLMDYVWDERHYSTIHFTPVAEAVRQAAQPGDTGQPLVIADYADNPGAGAYGDSTTLLKAMVEADLQNVAFYAICDPQAAREAAAAGVGSTITLQVGGKTDPTQGGGPLTLTGYVATITDGRFIAYGPMGGGVARNYGLSVLFRVGGIDIVFISNNGQATDLGQLSSLGIDPNRKSTLVVKSMQHFRAAFEPIARQVLEVDAGALCTKDFKGRPYQRVRRPLWPLDDI